MSDACPCGRQDAKGRLFSFLGCCEPYLRGAAQAPDAKGVLDLWTTNNVGEVGLEAKAVLA